MPFPFSLNRRLTHKGGFPTPETSQKLQSIIARVNHNNNNKHLQNQNTTTHHDDDATTTRPTNGKANADITMPKVHTLLTSDLGTEQPLHISLSRPLVLKAEQRQAFVESLRGEVERSGVVP